MSFNISSKKILATVIILNIIVLFVWGFFFSIIKDKNKMTSDLTSELNKQVQQESELKLISNRLNETKEERKKVDSYFIQGNKEGVAKFIDVFDKLGKYSGVSVKVTSIVLKDSDSSSKNKKSKSKKSVGSGLIETMKLNLKTEGRWSNTVYFIELLSKIPYKITLEKVALEKENVKNAKISKEKSLNWRGSLNISILKLKDK